MAKKRGYTFEERLALHNLVWGVWRGHEAGYEDTWKYVTDSGLSLDRAVKELSGRTRVGRRILKAYMESHSSEEAPISQF